MIKFANVSHQLPNGQWLLHNQSLVIGDRERIGVYAPMGSGKSTLAKLFSGSISPHVGSVYHKGAVSWPVGLAGPIHPDLTVWDNAKSVAQLTTKDPNCALETFENLNLGDLSLRDQAKSLSPTERSFFGFCLSLMVRRQHYIFDEVYSTGTAPQRRRIEAYLTDRLRDAGLIVISRNAHLLKRHCSKAFVLKNAVLIEADFDALSNKVAANV